MKGCRPFTELEATRVEQAIGGRYAARDRALFVLGLHTGFRIAELLSLEVGAVWNGEAVLERVHVSRRHMKKRTEGRTVPLHERARTALGAWLSDFQARKPVLQASDPLFPGFAGADKPMSRVAGWRVLKRAYRRAGLDGPGLASHSMRKTFAARVYEAVAHDLVKTQRAMGHRNINSTVQYIGFLDADIDRAILAA